MKGVLVFFIVIIFTGVQAGDVSLRTPERYDFLKECDIPLGMSNGAIEDAAITSSHRSFVPDGFCSKEFNGGRLGMKTSWCVSGFHQEEIWFQINFQEITIVSALTVKVHYWIPSTFRLFFTNLTASKTEDFAAYGVIKGKNEEVFTGFLGEQKIYLNTPISGRILRIQIEEGAHGLDMQFELYGCPYWMYAKPLGITKGLEDSQLSEYLIGGKVDGDVDGAQNVRFNSLSNGWNPNPRPSLVTVSDQKCYLQVDLKETKKITYISMIQYFASSPANGIYSNPYSVEYGENENALKFYQEKDGSVKKINPPLYTTNERKSFHVFWYSLVARIFRYIPYCDDILNCVSTKFELYGSSVTTPDIQWRGISDAVSFNDLVCGLDCQYRETRFSMEAHNDRNELQSSRSPYLPVDDCLVDPDQCISGLSVSVKAFIPSFSDTNYVTRTIPNSQVKDITCNQLLSSPIRTSPGFSITISKLNIQHGALVTNGQISITNLNCPIGKDSLQLTVKITAYLFSSLCPLNKLTPLSTSTEDASIRLKEESRDEYPLNIDTKKILLDVVKSRNWNIGNDLTLLIELTGIDCQINQDATIKFKSSNVGYCYQPVETDPVNSFQDFQFHGCGSREMKIDGNGLDAGQCKDVTIRFTGFLLISAIKIFGSRNTLDNGIMTDFNVKFYDTDLNDYQYIRISGSQRERLSRYQHQTRSYEILPFPRPIYTNSLKITPSNNYEGMHNSFRLDVIQCDDKSEIDNLRWIKLNKDEVCFGSTSALRKEFPAVQNVDASHIMLVQKSGNLGCGKKYYWGCQDDANLIDVILVSSYRDLIISFSKSSSFTLKGNQTARSDKITGSLVNGVRIYFKMNDMLRLQIGIFNGVDGDGSKVCADVYALGTTAPRHRIANVESCKTSCSFVQHNSLEVLHYNPSSSEIFYFDVERHLVHASSRTCLKDKMKYNVFINDECNDAFDWLDDGTIVSRTTNKFLIADGYKITGRLSLVGNNPNTFFQLHSFMETENTKYLIIEPVRLHSFAEAESTKYLISEHTMVIVASEQNFVAGYEKCVSDHQGHPITIRTQAMWNDVKKYLISHNLTQKYFIGLRFESKKYTYDLFWQYFGDPFNYGHFNPLLNSPAAKKCVAVDTSGWFYHDCETPTPLICYVPPIDDDLTNVLSDRPSPKFNFPILSSGLQATKGEYHGRGFQFSQNEDGHLEVALQTRNRLFKIVGPVLKNNIGHFGMTYDKLNTTLKLFVNDKLYNQTNGVVITNHFSYPERYSNFMILSSYYDFSTNILKTTFADISVWKFCLDDAAMEDYPITAMLQTFNDEYVMKESSYWRIRPGCLNYADPDKQLCMDSSEKLTVSDNSNSVESNEYLSSPLQESYRILEQSCHVGTVLAKSSAILKYSLYRFKLNINRYSTVRKACIRFQAANDFDVPFTLRITALHIDSPLQDFSQCSPVSERDFSVGSSKLWTLKPSKAGSFMETTDLSDIVQAIPNVKWDVEPSITFIINDVNLIEKVTRVDIRPEGTTLQVYYDDHTPNNFYWLPPSSNWTSYIAQSFRTFLGYKSTIKFWIYMSGKDCGLVTMWIIDSNEYKDKVKWFTVGDQGAEWKRVSFTFTKEGNPYLPFALIFHFKHFGKRCNAAIDNLGIKTWHDSESENDAVYLAADRTTDFTGVELTSLKIPYPIYMFFASQEELKDLGLLSRNFKVQDAKIIKGRDKFGFDLTGASMASNADGSVVWSNLNFNFINRHSGFTILVHFQLESRTVPAPVLLFCEADCSYNTFSLFFESGEIRLWANMSDCCDNKVFLIKSKISLNVWYYVALTYDMEELRVYLDNELAFSMEVPYKSFNGVFNNMYAFKRPNKPRYELYRGVISCVRIYDTFMAKNMIKASEVCSVHQDHRFHVTKCRNGVNVMFQKECECDHDVRYYVDSCENALPKSLFKEASFYLSFDIATNETSEIGNMSLSTDVYNYSAGPVNDMICNYQDSPITIGSISNECIIDFTGCSNGFVVSFWLLIKNYREGITKDNYVFKLGRLILVARKGLQRSIHITTHWKDRCNAIEVPIGSFVYMNVFVSPTEMIAYSNGNVTATLRDLQCASETYDALENHLSEITVGSMVCLDELSVLLYEKIESIEKLYTDVVKSEIQVDFDIHRQHVELEMLISTSDLPTNAYDVLTNEFYGEEAQMIMESISTMLKQHIDSNGNILLQLNTSRESNFVDVKFNSVGSSTSAGLSGFTLNTTAMFKFITCEEQELLNNENVVYDMRKYSLQLTDRNIRVSSSPVRFTLEEINSTAIQIKIEGVLDEEQIRYHYGFKVYVNSTTVILKENSEKLIYLNTGPEYLTIYGLTPNSINDFTVWPLTHGGCGIQSTVETYRTSPIANEIPPVLLNCRSSSYQSLNISWENYPKAYLGSENLTFRVFWLKVDDMVDAFNITIYNFIDVDDRFVHYSIYEQSLLWNFTIDGLQPFTNYSVLLATVNEAGVGGFNSTYCHTDEWVPVGPPNIVDYKVVNSTAIQLNFSSPDLQLRNGIIRGYLFEIQNAIGERSTHIFNQTAGENALSFIFVELRAFMDYNFTVSAFTSVGLGPPSLLKNFTTPEDVPIGTPANMNITNLTSSFIIVQWERIPHLLTNGRLLNFALKINGTLANKTEHAENFNVTYLDYKRLYSIVFTGFTGTEYRIELAGCTSVGCGPSDVITVQTLEEVPSGTVNNLSQFNVTAKEILFVHWQAVLPMQTHGKIVEYKLTCHEKNLLNTSIIQQLTIRPANISTAYFSNLKNFTWYTIQISAATSIGYGPTANATYRTPENVPSAYPVITDGYNTSSTSFIIHFSPIPPTNHEGIFIGYHLFYQTAENYVLCNIANRCIETSNVTCLGSDTTNCSVENLELHTNYSVCLSGFTEAGDGPKSPCMFVETDTFVDGNWTTWTKWGFCDKSCGKGLEARIRFCINPEPARGGADCVGDSVETRPCNDFTCPAFYLSDPNIDCDVACPQVNASFLCGNRINTKNSVDVFETALEGSDYTKNANVTCHNGGIEVYSRSYHPSYDVDARTCNGFKNVPLETNCKSTEKIPATERRLCYCIDPETMAYLEWAEWGDCSAECGGGTRKRFRNCIVEPQFCKKIEDAQDCNTHLCPIDGSWGLWSQYGPCSQTCGIGVQKRERACINPEPKFGGNDCEGGVNVDYARGCNPHACPVHGGWSEWDCSPSCSQPCGLGGTLRAKRECNNPEPRFDGNYCHGNDTKETPCNEGIKCKEVAVNFKVRLPTQIWNYKMVYTNTKEFRNLTNIFFAEFGKSIENFTIVSNRLKSTKMNLMERGSVIVNFTLLFYEVPYVEIVTIQDFIDRVGIIGDIPVEHINVDTQDVPEDMPEFSVTSSSPYSLYISWNAIASTSTLLHGEFYVYYIFYRLIPIIDNNELPVWDSIGTVNTSIELKYLQPHQKYGLRMLLSNKQGNGIATKEKIVYTLSGKPSVKPTKLSYSVVNLRTLYCEWDAIPSTSVPGLLLGYKIVYRIYNGNLDNGDNDYTVLWNSATMLQRSLYSMKPNSIYLVEVAGYTSAGTGPWASITVKTPADAPSVCPPNITLSDKEFGRSITVSWHPIPEEFVNCNLTGYKLQAKLLRLGPVDLLYETAKVITLDQFTLQHSIADLKPYGEYEISLRGYGKEGDGPECTFIARTCKCPKNIYANFYQMKGYISVDRINKSDVDGLFPNLLTKILHTICDDCKSYKKSTIFFDRTVSGLPPEKLNEKDLRLSMGEQDHLNFPIFGRSFIKKINGKYPFVILAPTKGSALIVVNVTERTFGVWNILVTIASVWPLIAVIVFISAVFGWLFWFAEQTSKNSDMAIDRSITGFLHGMWVAVVTMTTVGYGDFTPSTVASKSVMIIWIFVGLISVSLFMSTISSAIYTGNINTKVKLYNTKTAVLNQSFEHQLAVLRNAQVKLNYVFDSNLTLGLLDAVVDKTVEIGLLDVLVAAEYMDEIAKRGLRIDQIIDSGLGVGVALSGGLEALEEDFKSLVLSSQEFIIKYLANKTKDFQPDPPTDIQTVILPNEDAFQMFIYFGIVFGIFGFLGVVYTCVQRRRTNSRVAVADKALTSVEMFEVCTKLVSKFYENFKANVSKKESLHSSELKTLLELQTNYKRLLKRSGFDTITIEEGLKKHSRIAARNIIRERRIVQTP